MGPAAVARRMPVPHSPAVAMLARPCSTAAERTDAPLRPDRDTKVVDAVSLDVLGHCKGVERGWGDASLGPCRHVPPFFRASYGRSGVP